MEKNYQFNLKSLGIVLLYCVVLLYAVPSMLAGGFSGSIKVVLVFLPFILALYLAARPIWMGILLGAMVFSDPLSGIIFFDRFRIGMVVSLFMITVLVLESALHKRAPILPGDFVKQVWTALALIITVRMALDPPGSARTGGTGGMAEAILYFAGAWVFFAAAWLATSVRNLKKQRRVVFVIVLVAVLREFTIQIAQIEFFYWGSFFTRSMWLLLACLLVSSLNSTRMPNGVKPWFYFWSLLCLTFGTLAEHRSRPVFALAMALSAAAFYKRFRRTAFLLGLFAFLGIARIMVVNEGHVPRLLVRTLSLVVNVDRAGYSDLGETGWESKFRAEMNKTGWETIKKHPLIGRGFAFTLNEMLELVATQRTNTQLKGVDVATLARAGGYHNTLLALMVDCGVFAGLLYVYCLLASLISFWKFTYHCKDPETKMMGAVLVIFYVPSVGQMLMNGHGYDFIVTAVLIGMMRGLQRREKINAVAMQSAGGAQIDQPDLESGPPAPALKRFAMRPER